MCKMKFNHFPYVGYYSCLYYSIQVVIPADVVTQPAPTGGRTESCILSVRLSDRLFRPVLLLLFFLLYLRKVKLIQKCHFFTNVKFLLNLHGYTAIPLTKLSTFKPTQTS